MVLLALTMLIGATAAPGVLAERSEDVRPSHLDLRETNIDASDVSGETVTLTLDSRLDHRYATANNVTVEARAIDLDTGLVATTERQSLGDISGDREVQITSNLTVERQGDYRLETIVYVDGQRRSMDRREVRNVDALPPEYAQSSVGFHRFENTHLPLRAISYRIVDVEDNRTTMNISVYLTNNGDDPEGDLELRLRARQADSNVVADESSLTVGQIRPGRTATVSTQLTVPDGYNYWLDGILLSDDVVVGTESAPANLDPTETLRENETRESTGFQSDDFEGGSTPMATEEAREGESTTIAEEGPGFTALAALVALLASAFLLARRTQ